MSYEATQADINEFMSAFCTYGSRDIAAAVQAAIEAGHDPDWAAEQCKEFADQTGSKLDDLDPVYCVMDAILQEARTEIDNLTDFDIMNDVGFDTYGNYMCSSYQYNDDDRTMLIEKLAEHDANIEDFEQATKYFLDQCEISQADIDEAKAQIGK
jgi:hypothetical protein